MPHDQTNQCRMAAGQRLEPIKDRVLQLLRSQHIRLTPASLVRTVRQENPKLPRKRIHAAIKALVDCGDVVYTHHFNLTQLEVNYHRPVQISPRITLSPPQCTVATQRNAIVIKLSGGASFGRGDHPTTRIALRAVEFALDHEPLFEKGRSISVLDIGTGSGVLAIAARKLGAHRVLGLDIDAVARHEAKSNVRLNGLHQSIIISNIGVEHLPEQSFDLIMANLRPPTLKTIIPQLEVISFPRACWVFSGFRVGEKSGVVAKLPAGNTRSLWSADDSGWAGLAIEWNTST